MVQYRPTGIGTRSTTPQTPAPAAGEVVVPARDPRRRANRYAAACITCGQRVQAEEGYLAGEPGAWKAEHIVCPTATPAAEPQTAQTAEPVAAEVVQTMVNGEVVFDGTYTLETLTGHRTFRLRTQGKDEEFMPGKQILEYLSGADNEGDYTRFGHVAGNQPKVWKRHQDNTALLADLKAFWADPSQALAAVQCYRCHRTLTVPSSVYNGLGPECAKKGL